MIEGTDLVSLTTKVRDLIGEETPKFWTPARVYRAINDEVQRLVRVIIGLDQGWFETTASPTVAATIALPSNCYTVRAVEVQVGNYWRKLTWVTSDGQYLYQTAVSGDQAPGSVQFRGDSLIISPSVTSVSAVRITYARLPGQMRYEAVAAAGMTSLTLGSTASPVDDSYIGDTVLILSGLGAGEYKTISDYVGSTKVATVSTWTATPDTDSTYSFVLPAPLDRWADLVCYGAAARLVARRRDPDLIGILQTQYGIDYQAMTESLGQRQTDQPLHVNYTPDLIVGDV